MARANWDPAQYGMFGAERLRPALDLLDRVPLTAPGTVYDLGCGPGTVTALIAARWSGATVTGVDSSKAMLSKAREVDTEISWLEADIATWRPPGPADLIYANASLHWLDDHDTLFRRLVAYLRPGGVLAVQIPRNFGAPSHRCLAEAAQSGPWRDKLASLGGLVPVAAAEVYYEMLAAHTARLDVWQTEYLHVLEGDNPVVEWTKGTALRPYLDALDDAEERIAFLADYAARIGLAYPRCGDGRTLLAFRRLFIVAVR